MDDELWFSRKDSAKGQLQRAAFSRLMTHQRSGDLPTSIRFLFYELVQARVIPKMATGRRRPDQGLIEAVTHLRNNGVIPWDWIADETRSLTEWRYASTVKEFMTRAVDQATVNPWPDEPPLLLCESRSLAGVLRSVVVEYVCPIASTNGQVGGFLHTVIAPILRDNGRMVLYLGDWDHQGRQIEENTCRVLKEAAGRVVKWERIAITEDQITANPTVAALVIDKVDNRYKPPRSTPAWETEVLGQGTIKRLVREKLDAMLPTSLSDVLERERAERAVIRSLLAQ